VKICNLHLVNFLSHTDTQLQFDRLSIVRGLNGVGKSSLEQAIEFLLTGRAESTDDRGAGAKDLIHKGAEKAYITAEIEQDGEKRKLRCILTEKSGRDVKAKRDDDPSYKGEDWIQWLASKRDIISCLVNGRYFVDMAPAAQKELLAGIILPDSYIWPDWVEGAVANAGIKVDWSGKPFDIIASVYDQAFKDRTAVNREIKQWQEPVQPASSDVSVDDIRAKLKMRQDERTALALERQKLLSGYQSSIADKDRAQKSVQRLEQRLEAERSTMNEVSSRILSPAKVKELQKIADGAKRAIELDTQIAEKNQRIRECNESIAVIEELAENPKCPTCKQSVTGDMLNAMLGPVAKLQGDLNKEVAALYHERKLLGDYEGAKKALEAHAQAERDLKLVQHRVHDFEKELKSAQDDLSKIQELPTPDTSDLDAKLADYDKRIQVGQDALVKAAQAVEQKSAYEKAWAYKKTLDAKLANLEKLIEYFGPKGVQAQLLDQHVGGFESVMNAVLVKWGFRCHLQFDPYSFGISFGDSETIFNLRTISKSQRYRFAVAFQIALASATGFRFAVIDGADILDNPGRMAFFSAMLNADMDQIIVCQTDDRTTVPQAKNTTFYMLSMEPQDGVPVTTVRQLTA